MLVMGAAALILSIFAFHRAQQADATHAAVRGYMGTPMTPEQGYGTSLLLELFGATCVVLAVRRAHRGDKPNV